MWWPNGYGCQPLYQVEVILLAEATELDRRQFQIGLRTLELSQELDEWGRSFTFVVNGVPIFAKGANWIPSDSFPTRAHPCSSGTPDPFGSAGTPEHAAGMGRRVLRRAKPSTICATATASWSGRILCSPARSTRLDDPAFVENVRHEVVDNVRRLRHRACLALWCGNNEMEAGWAHWGWTRPDTRRA